MKIQKTETNYGRVYWLCAHVTLHASHRCREEWRLNPRSPFLGIGTDAVIVRITRKEAANILREFRRVERGGE